jgi:chorismate-pyruvate lyase
MALTDSNRKSQELLAPLIEFRKQFGCVVPPVEWIEADELPQPYRDLLAHDSDMTSTLESFFGTTVRLQPLHLHRTASFVLREVLLVANNTGRPVEYGAIRIHLGQFSPPARERIRRSVQPLGAIMAHYNIPAEHHLGGFFRVTGDESFLEPLHIHRNGSSKPVMLYGRSNRILDDRKRPLAEVVEILPPLDGEYKE